MSTRHFNQLTEAQQERLVCLQEDLLEGAHAVSKILRHGYESFDPTDATHPGNRKALQNELAQIVSMVWRMEDAGDLSAAEIEAAQLEHARTPNPYLHHNAQLPEAI